MERLAILIQAPLSGSDYRSGVCLDIVRWKNFLTSLPGGAWNEDEIIVLTNPSKKELSVPIIKAKYSDFALIAFSGHGFIQKDDFLDDVETFLYLNDSRNRSESTISEYEMNPGTPRCILSFDCCRDFEKGPVFESIKDEAYSRVYGAGREYYRKEFERQVLRCEKGCTRLYSASLTEEANDKPSFTQILISFAERWSKINPHKSLNIRDAIFETADIMNKRYHISQTPEYNGGRRLNHFPFIIG